MAIAIQLSGDNPDCIGSIDCGIVNIGGWKGKKLMIDKRFHQKHNGNICIINRFSISDFDNFSVMEPKDYHVSSTSIDINNDGIFVGIPDVGLTIAQIDTNNINSDNISRFVNNVIGTKSIPIPHMEAMISRLMEWSNVESHMRRSFIDAVDRLKRHINSISSIKYSK